MTAILGISAFYHDSAAALVVDGQIVAAAQEERFTRRKHEWRYPARAIEYCLQEAGLETADLEYVAFYDKPLLKFDRLLETQMAFAPRGFRAFAWSMPAWLNDKLHVRRAISKQLGRELARKAIFPQHHQSHAASAFYPSPFDEAAILTLDGVGEWTTAAWGVGQGNEIRLLRELRFPHSVGMLYSAFTYYCGFRVNSGEYKLMGLAPYGEPKYADRIYQSLIDLKEDGSFRMDQRYFRYCHGMTMTSERFHRLFGGPPGAADAELTQRHMDVAASIQAVVEEIVMRMGRFVHAETSQRNLCLAGGVALNCVANGRLLREGPFERIWIQPAAGDAGGALGAALFVWHQLQGRPRSAARCDSQRGSLLGPEFDDAEIRQSLEKHDARFEQVNDDGELCRLVAALLAAGKIVGWMQGRMEYGPRALGARSILADPRGTQTQRDINLRIKFRESFRPFAPAVLAERAHEFFDLSPACESPYMLLVAPVAADKRKPHDDLPEPAGLEKLQVERSVIPAVTHVDDSARVQTVDAQRNPLFHRLLSEFASLTGLPVLVNTSFNVRGEPIVCSPEDAWRCFMSTELDVLVVGKCLLSKEEQSAEASIRPIEKHRGYDVVGDPAAPAVTAWHDAGPFELRVFGVVLAAIAAAFAWAWADALGAGAAAGLGLIALACGGVFLTRPATLKWPHRLWMVLTYPLRWLASYAALGVLYYGVMTPIACTLRLRGRDPLAMRIDRQRASYWIRLEPIKSIDDYFRQF